MTRSQQKSLATSRAKRIKTILVDATENLLCTEKSVVDAQYSICNCYFKTLEDSCMSVKVNEVFITNQTD